MRTSSRVALACLTGVVAILATAPAHAQLERRPPLPGAPMPIAPPPGFMPPPGPATALPPGMVAPPPGVMPAPMTGAMSIPPPPPPGPKQAFQNPQQALSKYIEGYRAGDGRSSLDALQYAAEGGEALARWKLGSMYAAGDGVPHDDRKAYEFFLQIVEDYDENGTVHPRQRGVIASAFVSVGAYLLTGIPNSRVNRDVARAREMFTVAATEFADPHAQYNLGRLYLDGDGVKKNPRQAARWLKLAADKHHMESQALLGNLHFMGADGVQRQRAVGLMYLTMARDAVVDRRRDKWVIDLYESAMAQANDFDRQMGVKYLEDYLKGRR